MVLDLMFELAWKSGLVAGAALLAAALLGARPARERVAVLRLGVVMLLALPVLALALPTLRLQAPAVPRSATAIEAAPAPRPADRPAAPTPPAPAARTAVALLTRTSPGLRIGPVFAALALWAAGFSLLALRLLGGVALLRRWTRQAEPVADPRWLSALERAAAGRRRPLLRTSPEIGSPLSWGWRPAIILLDPAALARSDRADAVLAHEMGHVRHGDWLFLMASRGLLALFWFNPLVWILQRELARQSEQAADAWAADRIGRLDYAGALVAIAAHSRPHAALGMAAPRGELSRRVTALLNASAMSGSPWRAALAATACIGFATPLAAVELSAVVAPPSPPAGLAAAHNPPVPPSPIAAASAVSAALTAPTPPPAAHPLPSAQQADALRQRDAGVAMMEAGARQMEEEARKMRAIATGLDAPDRAGLNAEADDLVREAAGLRAEARALAALDPATLRPMSTADERELTEGLRQTLSVNGGPPIIAEGVLTFSADALTYPAPTPGSVNIATDIDIRKDKSGGWRTANGVEVAAREQLRIGARQLRDGAGQIEVGAEMAERSAASIPDPIARNDQLLRASDLRRQASDLRRQADAMDPDG